LEAQDVGELKKQLSALRRDIEVCSAETTKIDALYRHAPEAPAEILRMIADLKAPKGVDAAHLQKALSYETFNLGQSFCRVYLREWVNRRGELRAEAKRLEEAIDYAPLAPVVDALTKPIRERGDVEAVRRALAGLEDPGLAERVTRRRADLPGLVEEAKRRLIEYLVLKG
jgi:hypothetical protein